MSIFKNYRKKAIQPMRPYIPGEDMTGISVSSKDTLEEGGMIAVNPKNSLDRWYVAKQFFEDNYIEVEEMEQRIQSLEEQIKLLNKQITSIIKLTGIQKDINNFLCTQIKIINEEITQK